MSALQICSSLLKQTFDSSLFSLLFLQVAQVVFLKGNLSSENIAAHLTPGHFQRSLMIKLVISCQKSLATGLHCPQESCFLLAQLDLISVVLVV